MGAAPSSFVRRFFVNDVLRLMWSWIYGLTLIIIGVGCASVMIFRVIDPEFDAHMPFVAVVFELAMLCFISIGAIVIGVERIKGSDFRALRPAVKPDAWLVEKFGPKGSFWRGRSAQEDERDR